MTAVTKPRRELLWLSNIASVQTITIANPLDFRIEQRFGQSESLYFTIRADDQKAPWVIPDITVRWGQDLFFVYEVHKARGTDGTALIEVECPTIAERLADDKLVGTFNLDAVTVTAGLTAILAGSGWTGSIIDPNVDTVTLYSLVGNDASVLALVRKWAKITTNEVDFDTTSKTVTFAKQIGQNRGVGFRYGSNVTAIDRRSRPPAFTKLYPFGKDELSIGGAGYIEDLSFYTGQGLSEATARTLYTREEIWSDPSFITAPELLAAATERLALGSQPVIEYTMSVVDLAELTGITSDVYNIGDTVTVTDEPLGFDVVTRVVRIVRRPLEPARSEVELSYLPPVVPDPNVGGSRGDTTEEWELFETRSPTLRKLRNGTTILGRLALSTVAGAEWVVGFEVHGLATGTGTYTITVVDDLTAASLLPTITIPVVSGEYFRHSFSFGETDIASGDYIVAVRGQSSGAAIGFDVQPFGCNLWVLARGTVQRALTLANSQRFDDGSNPSTTQFTVPADVHTVTIEAAGSKGVNGDGGSNANGGNGGAVTATFAVTPGSILDVVFNGAGTGDTVAGSSGGDGGRLAMVCPTGGTVANAYIVAAGGGGGGGTFGATITTGGAGGYFAGTGVFLGGTVPGQGATDTAGGVAGTGGTAGTAGQGGNAGDTVNGSAWSGGGGGGGYFGGGGAGIAVNNGDRAGGGGGGSGFVSGAGYDIDPTDGANAGPGYVIISWDTPT